MFTLKTGKAENYLDTGSSETRLRVPFSILDQEGGVATERIESFPITATPSEVEETLKRHLDVFTQDWQRYEAGKARQEALNQSQQLADEISNKEIQ
jgi:hypothetical protein